MHVNLHFYIDLDWTIFIEYPEIYLQEILHIVEFSYNHKISIYYNEDRIRDFVSNIEDLDSNYTQSIGNMIDLILRNARPHSSTTYLFRVLFSDENTSLEHFSKLNLANTNSSIRIGLISKSHKEEQLTLLLVVSNEEFEKINLSILNNIDRIRSIIITNTNRVFNLSKKHGELGKGNWVDASPLLCSKEEAYVLLQSAIAWYNDFPKKLYNFDTIHETYIEFYSEGDNPLNQWHGFHIDKKEWSRVPDYIKSFFDKKK